MTAGGQSSVRSGRRRAPQLRARLDGAVAQPLLPSRIRAGWLAFLLAVTLALSWQSFLTQTHQHFASAFTTATTQGVGTATALPDRTSPDQPATCPICREIAHAGYYLFPTLATIDAPIATTFDFGAAVVLRPVLVRRSHAWQSRAPPVLLQA
jgi:hypothetical protein